MRLLTHRQTDRQTDKWTDERKRKHILLPSAEVINWITYSEDVIGSACFEDTAFSIHFFYKTAKGDDESIIEIISSSFPTKF